MKLTFIKKSLFTLGATFLLVSGSAVAQDKATSLDQLLQNIKNDKVSETREFRQREARFRSEKAQQGSNLKKAEQQKTAEEQRSAQLEATYKEQELQIQQLRAKRDESLGSLKELFGHLTSTAGDLRSTMDISIVSAQYPGRTKFIDELIEKMNSETKLPSIQDVEKLWYELQREIVEGGKIVKFQGVVASASGEPETRDIVRIGNYNLVSDGVYFSYKDGIIQGMNMGNQGPLAEDASALVSATSGFTKTGIDPTGPLGGGLLEALVQNSKGLKDYIDDGGTVGLIILAVGAVAFIIALLKFFYLLSVGAKVRSQLKAKKARANNPLGRVLKIAEENPTSDTESLELKIEEAVLKERPAIESWIGAIKIISMIAPLMGLLGTVTGMIQTFEAITIFGAGDPKNMAGGISSALMTTVMGLIVAIPTVLLHTWLNSRAKGIIHILDEQSAGIIAEKSERK